MIQLIITNFINIINYLLNLIFNGEFYIILFFSLFLFLYLFLILALTYFLLKRKNKINNYKYISLIKDKEFIIFKDNLFKFYGSILIILFIFLFKHNSFYLILGLEFYFLFFILLIYFILISNFFILFLFNIFLSIKVCINMLNEVHNFYPQTNKFYSITPLAYFNQQARSLVLLLNYIKTLKSPI